MCAVGCSPRVVRVPVEGVVTLDGKPVAEAAVTFMPRFPGRPGVAVTDNAGRFLLQDAGMKPGVAPGEYDVVVFKADGAPTAVVEAVPESAIVDPKTFNTVSPATSQAKAVRYIVPERYGSPHTSKLGVTISRPVNDLTFALTTKP